MSSPAPAASPAEDIAPQPDAIIVSPASHEANYTILIGVIAAVSIVFLPLFVLICCNICSRYRALNREAARDLSFQAPSAPNSPKDDFDNTPVPVPPVRAHTVTYWRAIQVHNPSFQSYRRCPQ